MELKEQIIQSQRLIIERLAVCEESIGRLYSAYGTRFPALAAFWMDLAHQEASHAKLLQMMHRQLDKGSIFRNLGRFDKKNIEGFISRVGIAVSHVDKGSVTQDSALATAMALENSFLDSHFYDVVQSDSKEYRIVAEKLACATQRHRDLVTRKWMDLQPAR